MILISYVSPFFKIGGISGYFRLIWKHSVPQRNVKYVFKRSNEAIKVISCKLKFISAYPAPSFFAMEKRADCSSSVDKYSSFRNIHRYQNYSNKIQIAQVTPVFFLQVICATQPAGGELLRKQKYVEVMLNIFETPTGKKCTILIGLMQTSFHQPSNGIS